MGYKEQLGVEAGLQGGAKVSDEIVPAREQAGIVSKAKREQEEKKFTLLKTALEQSLKEKVKKGEITATQAHRLERGEDPRRVFN